MSQIKTGCANLPLHGGSAPPWLFKRMVKLAGAVTDVLLTEYSQDEFLRRIADPFWFQAFGNVLGYDWHSSGLSTVTCGALKMALNKKDSGIKVAGGKGATSRKAPSDIEHFGQLFSLSDNKIERLKYSSRLSAKIDSSLIQDSYQLYQHCFIFTEKGKWAVIQQGMNPETRYARRYHWLSSNVDSFVNEPHEAICCDKKQKNVLDMTSKQSAETRKISVDLVKENPIHLQKYFRDIKQKTLQDFFGSTKTLIMPAGHYIKDMKKINIETLRKAHEIQPGNYEELVAIKGVGPKTVRSLALISDLVYGKPASWEDPVRYSFAHGGKDGVPRAVDKRLMDRNTRLLQEAVKNAKLGNKEKLSALKRLSDFV